MKKHWGWILFSTLAALCVLGAWLILRASAEYPALDAPVSYPVNQVDGFELTIEKPSWSPFKGYTIRWKVSANSEDVYTFSKEGEGSGFEYLERLADGQWYRLGYTQDAFPSHTAATEFRLGGEEGSSLSGSIVQKYAYYGTRLEPGTYRVVLEMRAKDGTPHSLAAEFEV